MQEAGQLTGKRLNQVRALTHAEAHSLMRAYERLGSLPKEVTLHVDRLTCNFCAGRNGLEQLRQFFGIEKLTVVSRSGKTWNFPR